LLEDKRRERLAQIDAIPECADVLPLRN